MSTEQANSTHAKVNERDRRPLLQSKIQLDLFMNNRMVLVCLRQALVEHIGDAYR